MWYLRAPIRLQIYTANLLEVVMAIKRNYKKEYKEYHSKTEQKKNRAGRNTARRRALAAGIVKKGSGKDVHHKDGNPRNNKKSNLKVVSSAKNRGTLRVRKK
jgi:Zn-dependent membrane protease YugP